jgi:hypothetical protein
VRLRILTVALVSTLAVAGLAACRTNVGNAATIDGYRISESDVNNYLTPAGPDPSVVAKAKAAGQEVASPRSEVMQFLVQEQVFRSTLASLGPVPTAAQLAALHDEAASVLLQTTLTGDALDKALKDGLPTSGISAKFAPVYLRVQELEYSLIKSQHLTQLTQLVALVKKAGVKVSVSPRYGTWDPKTLALDGKAVVPSYLTVQPTPGGSATPSQPAA